MCVIPQQQLNDKMLEVGTAVSRTTKLAYDFVAALDEFVDSLGPSLHFRQPYWAMFALGPRLWGRTPPFDSLLNWLLLS